MSTKSLSGRQAVRTRRVVAFAVATAIGLIAVACTAGTQEGPAANTPAGQSPSAASPAEGSPAIADEIQAEGMSLVGNVPGSDGSLAFWGDLAVVDRWEAWPDLSVDDGFIVVDISDPTNPTELSRFRCIASFSDISIWKDLVFVSQNFPTAGEGCDASQTRPSDPKAFAGIRIISIADPEHPKEIATVATGLGGSDAAPFVWGSHTHTLLPDLSHEDASGRPAPRLIIYSADAGGELYGTKPHGSIVEVPLRDPSAARVLDTIDNRTNAPCHDFTVHMSRELLTCSAYDAGVILFDISDPVHPVWLSNFKNLYVVNHHSTIFSNDGNTLVLDAEIDTRVNTTACAGGTGESDGALWFYDISDPKDPKELGFFQLPRPTTDHFCYSHESNVIPMEGPRDVMVTGWFGGGVDMVDFTDPSHPREIAYWVTSAPEGAHSFAYAGYWYNGYVYAGNTTLGGLDSPASNRGFDVFAVDDSLLSNAIHLSHMNAQTQEPIPRSSTE